MPAERLSMRMLREVLRLYLALGVTTIRTAGSVAPYTDLEIKRLIDSGLAAAYILSTKEPFATKIAGRPKPEEVAKCHFMLTDDDQGDLVPDLLHGPVEPAKIDTLLK